VVVVDDVFTFMPHCGHVPSARACCTPSHIGQSSCPGAVVVFSVRTVTSCLSASELWSFDVLETEAPAGPAA